MAEEQQQSPGAAQQPNDNSLNEPSIGMMYDKEKDQAKVFSQNPEGSIGTVDPTPENESLFFVMDKNIPLNFYKNLQKYHNNPADGSTVYEESVGQQVMASVSIGPDKRLYCGTIGASNIGSIKAFDINKALETDSWSIRGGDIQGTNRQK